MKNKNILVAVAVVLGLGGLMLLSDRPVSGPGGSDIIRNANEYAKVNTEASELVLAVFAKADAGKELTEDERDKVRKGSVLFETMRGYAPLTVGPNFGAGKCYMLLGETQKAAERFEQAYFNRNLDPNKDDQLIKLTVVEAEGLLSECLLDMGVTLAADAKTAELTNDPKGAEELTKRASVYLLKSYDYANAAVTSQPEGIRYLCARANVLMALEKKEEGVKDIQRAYKIAPKDWRVLFYARALNIVK